MHMCVYVETPKSQHVHCKYKYPMKSKFDYIIEELP